MKKILIVLFAICSIFCGYGNNPADDNVWPDQVRMEQLSRYQNEHESVRRAASLAYRAVTKFRGNETIVFYGTVQDSRIEDQTNAAIQVFEKNGYYLFDIRYSNKLIFKRNENNKR